MFFALTVFCCLHILYSMQQEPHALQLPLLSGSNFLKFVIDFVQKDLQHMRQGDWLNLCDDFEMYLSRKGQHAIAGPTGTCILATPTHPPLPEHFEVRHFEALQRVTLPLVRQLASQTGSFSLFPSPVNVVPHGCDGGAPGRNQLVVHGDTEQCFLTVLVWLVHQEPPDRILACPECGRFFYRVKQQVYCSRTCGNRMTVRHFRARAQVKSF